MPRSAKPELYTRRKLVFWYNQISFLHDTFNLKTIILKTIKRFVSLLFALTFIALAPTQADAFAGGDGSAEDPFQISTCLELQDMNTDLDASFILISNIDCSATTGWNAGAGFAPVGDASTPFAGTLDGQGSVISGLFIDNGSLGRIGLFGQTSADAEITNMGLESVDFSDGIGGAPIMGGLVGFNAGLISISYSTGTILSDDDGFSVGGLVGQNTGTITNSYSKASVTNINSRVAGLTGLNSGTITNSYSTGAVSGGTPGGLVASNSGTITDSFWDTETSGQATSAGGTGKTTAEMKDVATFTDTDTVGLATAWDFVNDPNDDAGTDDIWAIDSGFNAGYPVLSVFFLPDAPTSPSATAVSDTQINLSWTAPDDGGSAITGYKIERKIGAGAYSTLVADTGTTATTYSDTGLTAETLYTYKISAINAIGTSSASTEVSATTSPAPTGSAVNYSGGGGSDAGDDPDGTDDSSDEESTSDGAGSTLTQEQRDAFQNQINEIRKIVELLIEFIRVRFGITI